jgi:hypothetical protein
MKRFVKWLIRKHLPNYQVHELIKELIKMYKPHCHVAKNPIRKKKENV